MAAALHCKTWTALFTMLLWALLQNRSFKRFFLMVLVTSQGPSPQSSIQCKQRFPWCTVCLVWLALGVREIPYVLPLLQDFPFCCEAVLSERSALFMSVWMSGKDGSKPWRQECILNIYQAHFTTSSLLSVCPLFTLPVPLAPASSLSRIMKLHLSLQIFRLKKGMLGTLY